MNFQEFQEQIGITFQNQALLKQAFTHSSYVNEQRKNGFEDNERLEFLGDAVLELSISNHLFTTFPDLSEGELTKLRSSIVCEPSLVSFAKDLHVDQLVLLGKGEDRAGGRERPALLADVFEALIGAIYVDQGLSVVEKFLSAHVYPKIATGETLSTLDFKSQLQEKVQRADNGEISYQIVREIGPAHNRKFMSEVHVQNRFLGRGTGRTKKEAEQNAAKQALQLLADE